MQATPNKKTLVIAEKRTVGKVLARHLGCKNDHGTWIEGAAYDVVWAQGHLMRLLLPEEYKEHPEWSNSGARLPIDPGSDGWRWKSPDGGAAAEQFNCMATLLQGWARDPRMRPRPRGPGHRRPGAARAGLHSAGGQALVLLA